MPLDSQIMQYIKTQAAEERGEVPAYLLEHRRLWAALYLPRYGFADSIHQRLTKRWDLLERINKFARNGKVAINTGGRDCDMCVLDGDVRVIDATYPAFKALYDALEDSAEGPFWAYPVPWDEHFAIRPTSRDLALEAFEDGHPHVVYP